MLALPITIYLGLNSLSVSELQRASPQFQASPSRSAVASPSTTVPVVDPGSVVLTYAEQMPTFTGGEVALHRYLITKINYPVEAFRAGLSGTVVMQFVVDEQGRVLDPVVVRSSNPVFNVEATRLVWLMPLWTPGQQQGQPVRVRVTLPIVFSFKKCN